MASVWYCNHCGAKFYSETESREHWRAEHMRPARAAAIPLYCNDCEADITDDPLTHDCPERRARLARLARLAAADRYRRRFLACVALLVGILAGAAVGLVMIWKWGER